MGRALDRALALDVDHLKSLNDHLAGAEAVRLIGHITGAQIPEDAVACRTYNADAGPALFRAADEALSRAERQGGNCVRLS